MTKQEHLDWCKGRALEYVKDNDLRNAWTLMASDLSKHPETENHPGIQLGMMLLMANQLNTPAEMEKFINGFN
jgi:hypothetical protein